MRHNFCACILLQYAAYVIQIDIYLVTFHIRKIS
jgi:hypothetical protein